MVNQVLSHWPSASPSPSSSPHSDETQRLGPSFPLPLPPEVLLLALSHLSPPDLAACVRVNSSFAHLSLPLLHKRIRLSDGPWPVYDDDRFPGPVTHDRPSFLQRRALVQYTYRVDVHAHSADRCSDSLPSLPKLRVLRVFLKPVWSGRRIYHTNTDLHFLNARPNTPCGALHLLRPATLVVRGLTLVHSAFPFELPPSIVDGVQYLACVFEPDEQYILPRNGLAAARTTASMFRHRLPAYITGLTLVFYPYCDRGWRNAKQQTLTWRLVHAYASALWAQIIAWITNRGHERRLTIVNVGALAAVEDEEAPGEGQMAELQNAVREEFVDAIEERLGHMPEHAKRRLEGVSFVSMREFLESEEAGDVFDPREIERLETWN